MQSKVLYCYQQSIQCYITLFTVRFLFLGVLVKGGSHLIFRVKIKLSDSSRTRLFLAGFGLITDSSIHMVASGDPV